MSMSLPAEGACTTGPVLHIYPETIEANARSICGQLTGIDIVGVTKATCANPFVARALVAGGAKALGDSRVDNLRRLRHEGLGVPLWLLRSPTPAQADEVVKVADVVLVAELETMRALDAAAEAAGGCAARRLGLVVMVDMGDLREGIMPTELDTFMHSARHLCHADVVGIGTNLTCYGAVVPTRNNLSELLSLTELAENILGRRLLVSGGNSSSLESAFAEGLPKGITGLRVGESILLGVSTITRQPLPGLAPNAFVLEAPVIECRIKPTVPLGRIAQNAFGTKPRFANRGHRLCAICALGRQDCLPEGLQPMQTGVQILGASSDHLIVDVGDAVPAPAIGRSLYFLPNYGCLLAAFTSPYVEKRIHSG
ncbi:MAG: alanine/ornithine racemase family PLP-dependent enzyme [Actinobacteria bacterium]|nr:alanine/ornithine racemase family PLP-dependent enzyme [Actinomycetota bacterium]